ncbi:MAG TPA: hemolysin family protein [Caulobacteraceae bacterium]
MRALFSRFGRPAGDADKPAATTAAHASADAPVDMVDQAEAFKELRVQDVMTPRADVIALDITTPLEDIVKTFVEAEHSRMPVYRETLDDPIGVVHIKDVLKLIAPDPARPSLNWSEPALYRLRRDVLYVPASMRAQDLLLKMQATRIHMAMVIDEFGGADGLVTLEDLVEAVVGEIEDEHDEHAGAGILQRGGDVFEIEARASLEDLETAVGENLVPEDLEDEEVDTVAGLVSTLAGRVPQRGEVIPHPLGYEFEILDADPRRVKRLRLRKVEPPPPPDPAR